MVIHSLKLIKRCEQLHLTRGYHIYIQGVTGIFDNQNKFYLFFWESIFEI